MLLTAAAVGAVALSGCSTTNPTTTLLRYAPSDGVEMDGESIAVRNLLVVSHGGGAPGVVAGSVVNSGTESATLTVTVAGQEATPEVTVEPGQAVRLDGVQADGSAGGRLTVDAVDVAAGQVVEVRVQSGGGDPGRGRPRPPAAGAVRGLRRRRGRHRRAPADRRGRRRPLTSGQIPARGTPPPPRWSREASCSSIHTPVTR